MKNTELLLIKTKINIMSLIKIQIKSVFGKILFEYEKENNTVKETVEAAVAAEANLRYANLRYANLSSANLSSANLRYADLSSANLSSADLRSADLRSADLRYANLSSANLSSANLRYADLSSANLSSADLRYADLRSADLRYADLRSVRNDLWDVLLRAIPEIPNLKKAIIEGKIDGSTYEGECACLCGTLMHSKNKVIVKNINNVKNAGRPIERFFLGIKKGDTPETNEFSKIALQWVNEFEGFLQIQN